MHRNTDTTPPCRNIEVKAALRCLEDTRAIAARGGYERLGFEYQTDTYFRCARGRLKLRERRGLPPQLIWYVRSDQCEPRPSDYRMLAVPDEDSWRETLQSALGVRATVVKRREVFLCDHIRIHLDEVQGLGCFLELEAVQQPHAQGADDRSRVRELARLFGVTPQDFLARSYVDMIEEQRESGPFHGISGKLLS